MSLLANPLTLPCGLELPNRLAKAAMAEVMAPEQNPDGKFSQAYSEWADGGWGFVFTGNVQVSQTYLGSPGDVAIPVPAANTPALQTAWRNWATATQQNGAPALVQLCHPGRQSPPGAGKRSFLTKNLAPSPVALNLGSGSIARIATCAMFGTPREMTRAEIDEAMQQFIEGAKQAHLAGFKGIELHGAHGYLIAQFLSPKTNLRTDEFGGSPAKRAEMVLRIIKGIRAATSSQFCVGIKMNSVDVSEQGAGGLEAGLEQMGLIINAGVDFIEISGGSYENPSMFQADRTAPAIDNATAAPARTPKASTLTREAFFLDFAKTVRERHPKIPLMVTGGFRSRAGMEAALASGACDIIGIGRPAAVVPKLPKLVLLNKEVSDADAKLQLKRVEMGWLMSKVPIRALGAGAEGKYYGKQIQRMGQGLQPIDTRV